MDLNKFNIMFNFSKIFILLSIIINIKSSSFTYKNFTKTQNVELITEKILKNNLPINYDFFADEDCTLHIKDQGNCGSCWAFASTTSLAYRIFKKYNISIDLSPQYLLSCSGISCSRGCNILDNLRLMQEIGTVTASCRPYTSSYDVVEDCNPKTCINGDYIQYQYFMENGKHLFYDYFKADNDDKFSDLVVKIMKEIYLKGPVMSSISFNKEFKNYQSNKEEMNDLYEYDFDRCEDLFNEIECNFFNSSHAVVIFGYGKDEKSNEYYWLIQNSWGHKYKKHLMSPLTKIKIGQIGIERVFFGEAVIKRTYYDFFFRFIISFGILSMVIVLIIIRKKCIKRKNNFSLLRGEEIARKIPYSA